MKINENKNLIGILYLLLTAIIWGGSFIAQVHGGKILGSFSFVFYRCLLGCPVVLLMIYWDNYKKYHKITFWVDGENKKTIILNSFWCGFVLFLALMTQQIGGERTDVAKAGLIASLEVIVVPILMLIMYRKKIRLITWVFIITAMLGIMMLSFNSISGINEGDIWVFVSTVLYSITVLQIPKYVKKVNPLKFSLFRFVVVGLLGLMGAFIYEKTSFDISMIKLALPSILYSGILVSGISYTTQILGQQYCEPVIATLIMSLEGVFAAIFGWIIMGQSLNFLQIIGCLIATVSIVFVQITDNQSVT